MSLTTRLLIRHAAFSQRDAARWLRMGTGSAVCQCLRRLDIRLETDKALKAKLLAIDRRLANPTGAQCQLSSADPE